LRPSLQKNFNYQNGGGSYPNLFCGHPPFQIDGNFGGAAGIAEMLVQSQNGMIELLPAIPAAWKTGRFDGLCVQGGGEISASWEDGVIKSLELKAKADHTFLIKMLRTSQITQESSVISALLNGKKIELPVDEGKVSINLKQGDRIIIPLGI